jgi:tRNA (guanine37-N1)-methyltransferase
MIVEALTRLVPGALGNEDSAVNESFSASVGRTEPTRCAVRLPSPALDSQLLPGGSSVTAGRGILDCPHYTRPPSFRGWDVPEVLLGGNHDEIRRWRRKKALEKTLRNRPDLLVASRVGSEDPDATPREP